jgi:hypothetical protein
VISKCIQCTQVKKHIRFWFCFDAFSSRAALEDPNPSKYKALDHVPPGRRCHWPSDGVVALGRRRRGVLRTLPVSPIFVWGLSALRVVRGEAREHGGMAYWQFRRRGRACGAQHTMTAKVWTASTFGQGTCSIWARPDRYVAQRFVRDGAVAVVRDGLVGK